MATIPPGSYAETSRNVTFTGTPGRTECYLEAECRNVAGQYVKSKLKYDIANNNGALQWAPGGIDH